MERLIIDIESVEKARELQSVVSELGFVKQVTAIHDVETSPFACYKNDDAFTADMEQRFEELENGTVRGISLEELEAGTRQSRRRSA